MIISNNTSNNSKSSVSFGYGKGIRELVKEAYPYCALTGKEYGGGPLRITTDHILPHHYGGATRDFNYLFINKETNVAKGCKSLKKVIAKHPEYINNLLNYFDALLNSTIPRVQKYAKAARETAFKELTGMHSNLETQKISFEI